MADLTFKGTTQQVLLEIGKGALSKIDANTKVTITDNEYTLGNLTTITTTVTANKIKLEKTSAAVDFADTFINLNTVLPKVEKYTGAVTITDNVAFADVANLNKIAGLTTGKVTATLLAGAVDSDLVTALENVNSKDNIYFKATNAPLADNSDVRALISLSKLLPKADFSAINSIISSDVSLVKQALAILKNNANVAVDISAIELTAKDANDIAKATKGKLTAIIKDGGVAATLKALSDVTSADDITFTTTDRTVKASDLANLGAKFQTIANFNVASVTKITGESKDITSIVKAIAIAAGADVTVSGTITAADVATIKAAGGSGVLTANVQAAEADQLNSSLTTGTFGDELNLVVNGQTALATDLNDLITKTAGTIKLEAKDVRGDVTALTALYDTNKASFIALGNENVTITGANPTEAQLNTIAAATTGKVTATLAPVVAINDVTVKALKDVKASDDITFVANTAALADKDAMNALLDIKKIIKNADFSAIKNISTAGENDVALVKNVLKLIDPASAVTFTGTISAKDANDIAKEINGALTATIKDGSVSSTLNALKNIDATIDDLTFKTTDTTVKASDLAALAAKFNDITQFNVINVKTVTGNAADADDIADALTYLTNAASGTKTTVEVKISGNVAADEINDIIKGTNGKVTATLKAATAAELVTALTDDITAPVQNNTINVTVNDTIVDAAALSKTAGVSGLTSGKIKVDSLEVGGTFAQLNELYITNKAQFTGLGNEKVEITGTESALNVDVIAKATSGILEATLSNATANVLVSQLKNANAKDALAITVIDGVAGTTTSAKDLLTLDGKTSVLVNAGAVTAISGSVAEINKLAGADVTLSGAEAYTISGTVKAADLSDIADSTTGVITATTVAADTAQKLAYALGANANLITNVATNQINLKVTGATAAAADLVLLNGITAVNVQVDAKEITGTIAQLGGAGTGLYVLATGFTGLVNKNVKIDNALDASVVADVTAVSKILAGTTSVVTATANGTVADLLTIANATTGKDALTFNISSPSATATDLLALDAKTSVKIDATALSVNGFAADLKQLVAAKGVQLAKNVAITVSDLAVAASDLGAILKATTGVVTATVTPSTASALNSALKDASSSDALILKVNGATAAAKDLISLDGKTFAKIGLTVGEITGNIAEITNVFITNAAGFDSANLGAANANISGTVDAAAADKIADATTGVVTATIKADTAAVLNTTLTDVTTNAYKLTVTGASAKATDLNGLNTKTSVAVDASAIKNIDGTIPAGAVEVNKVVTDANAGQITGLGNETVNLTGATDANATLVKAINDFTTGLITLPTITFDNGAATTFNLNAATLGDLNGITGLASINATNTVNDIITIKLADLLAANDSKGHIVFEMDGEASDKATFVLDGLAGWSTTAVDTDTTIVYTHTGGQTVTINTNTIADTYVI